jgi:nitronate monooxygenase
VLRNSTFKAWEAAGRPPAGQRPGEGEVLATSADGRPVVRYAASAPRFDVEGDIEALSIWAGQGVGLVIRSQPAGRSSPRSSGTHEQRCTGLEKRRCACEARPAS